jgi:NAD+ kinase
VDVVTHALKLIGGIQTHLIEGAETPFEAAPGDVVITVGGDGTFLSASHHVGLGTFIMGINSDPVLSKGNFCNVLTKRDAEKTLYRALCQRLAKPILIPRMMVKVDGHVVQRRVLNEALFSHSCPAAMTRFGLRGLKEIVACSGMWVGTGAGSTGALRSAGGRVMPLQSKVLQTVVREPFAPKVGPVTAYKSKFEFVSKTADATIYLDGPFLRVPVGFDQTMSFSISPEPLAMVGPLPMA